MTVSSGQTFDLSAVEYIDRLLHHLCKNACTLAFPGTSAKSLQLCPTLCDPGDRPHRAPPSLGFSRQEHWSGLHFLLQCMKMKSESEVTQSCPTCSYPMDCSLQGTSIHGICQARDPRCLSSKEFTCNAGDRNSIPGSGRSPGEGNGNLLQYSCLRNHMDSGAWWSTVLGVAKESCMT